MKNYNFKPGELVIYKYIGGSWTVGIFSHIYINEKPKSLNLYAINGEYFNIKDTQLLPLKGYEYLVGTKDNLPEEITLQEGELILASDYDGVITKFSGDVIAFNKTSEFAIIGKRGFSTYAYQFCLPLKDFDPKDLTKSKEKILKVRNGKLVKAF